MNPPRLNVLSWVPKDYSLKCYKGDINFCLQGIIGVIMFEFPLILLNIFSFPLIPPAAHL